MAVSNVLQTYGDTNIVTDVVRNAIEMISAKEDGIYSMLGKTQALAMVHSYQNDTLLTVGSLATEQGADFNYAALTTPTLITNLVQEVTMAVRVTRPQTAVQHFSGTNELSRQLSKGMSNWTNSVEFDLVRSTLVSGVSGTAQKMNGIIAAISTSTNHTTAASATVMSATILDGLMQGCWTNSNGDVATDIFIGSGMKRVFDTFTAKTNVVVNSPDIRDIVKTVTTYETSFGKLQVSPYMNQLFDMGVLMPN